MFQWMINYIVGWTNWTDRNLAWAGRKVDKMTGTEWGSFIFQPMIFLTLVAYTFGAWFKQYMSGAAASKRALTRDLKGTVTIVTGASSGIGFGEGHSSLALRHR